MKKKQKKIQPKIQQGNNLKGLVINLKKIENLKKIHLKNLTLKLSKAKDFNTKRDIARSIWKIKNAERNRKQKNAYYQRNQDKIIKKQTSYQKVYRKKNRDKTNAMASAFRYIKIPKNYKCEICKMTFAKDKHHENYSKPREVILCCKVCHAKLDKLRRLENLNTPNNRI